ncbi:MAG: transporter [Prevotella sp.]|nr:transporter [Bacteroides sp.]MCM1366592.1 transporter [Prevotella sp.]MCM1437311.1 transporter [Prevotella sp.]
MHYILRPNIHFHSLHTSGVISFLKNWTLPLSILAGIAAYFLYVNLPFLDYTHEFANRAVGVVQPLLIFSMLFLTFLSISPKELRLRKWHIWHMAIQLLLFTIFAISLTIIQNLEWRIVAECAMLCLLCPTATAAAVVTRKLGGSAADITSYTIVINLAIALAAPALLPLAHPHADATFIPTFIKIISKVFPLLICPLILALIIRAKAPNMQKRLTTMRDLPFYIWAVALAIAISVTVRAIVHSSLPFITMSQIALATFLCCIFQFIAGKRIGSLFNCTIEGGQALGQKNTVFIIWMGYTFLTPVTAVAGGFYSVWHNIFNSYQLYLQRKKEEESK